MTAERETESFDYIIVGAGSAGCVLANRLSADPNTRVLLLEAGGRDLYHWIHIPVGYLYTIGNPRTDWMFQTEVEKGLGNRAIGYARGKVLGGSSSINGMIYMRGQAQDYDGWAQSGNTGWSWADVLPVFKKFERFYEGESEFHGGDGELRVDKQRLKWAVLDAVRDAAQEIGLPHTHDFNTGSNEGVGYFHVTQKNGLRWSAVRAFLNPARKRPNLKIATKATVEKVTIEDGRATGIAYRIGDKPMQALAAREVILSAGAIGSPHLLQLSGIGDGETLAEHGIESVHHLPGVGRNLQDHLQIRAVYGVTGIPTLNQYANSMIGRMRMGLEFALRRTGPLTMAPSQLGIFAKSNGRFETPNIEFHVQPLSTEKLGERLHDFPGVTASVCNLRPTSRGSVTLRSKDPTQTPKIAPNYLATPEDEMVAVESLRYARRLFETKAMAPYAPRELKPGPDAVSDEDLLKAAQRLGTTIFHPVGTARMGSDTMAVVDGDLRVHGLRGLRVVDASVMPTITSGNTNAPTMMIAEKASEAILKAARA
ncbi:choline dehydrogenase [Tianweitania sp. BSSL-BM11]|uniref:Choline dehydrogenase n=1 Tax=Tianweitania aestuarii TaxID=2814886 RepID=A0ABS5RS92_9HYPH|nr:choline dehydrogenase [Tianweitania aestuarii]MBS9719099.1 choline dehydrogenase [Tianweitania aestuarii]